MNIKVWTNSEEILKYIIAGKSLFAVTSWKKNKRVIYSVTKSTARPTYWVHVPGFRREPVACFTIEGLRKKYLMSWAIHDEEADLYWRMFYGLIQILLTESRIRPTMVFTPSFNCPLCGRKLIGEKSIYRGYGPTCYKKVALAKDIGLLGNRTGTIIIDDPTEGV